MTDRQISISALILTGVVALFNVVGAIKPNWVTRQDPRYKLSELYVKTTN